MKNLSSDGAGVGGVLCYDSCMVGEEVGMSLPLLLSLAGIDHSRSPSCLSLLFLSKGA